MENLVHKSPTTIVTYKDNYIHKKFIGDEKKDRFERELSFLKTHKSNYLPHLIDYNSKISELIFSVLKGESPGFLDNTEASLLSLDDFHRIRDALFEIQSLSEKLIIHGDLAPHNIYLTGSRVVIADWDSYFHAENPQYRLYDYATLWSLLDTNQDDLINIFKSEYEDLKSKNLLTDFKYCYFKKINFLQKYPKQYKQGVKLREFILSKFQ